MIDGFVKSRTTRWLSKKRHMQRNIVVVGQLLTFCDAIMSESDGSNTMATGSSAPQIGKLLQEKGLITDQHIQFALREQKATGERLGECLTRIGFVTDSELARVLADQSGNEFLDLRTFTPDRIILSRIPVQIARQKNVLPLYVQDGKLHLALEDPYDIQIQETVFRVSGLPIVIHVGAKNELRKLIERFYYLLENPIEEELDKITTQLNGNPNLEVDVGRLLDMLLASAISYRGTDVHITPADRATRIMFRVDGVLNFAFVFPIVIQNRLVTNVKVRSGMDISEQRKPQDGRMSFEFLGDLFDIRVSTVRTNNGENVVMRLLPSRGGTTVALKELGFTTAQLGMIKNMFLKPYGMVLVCGPTGSGKTTTLYAALREQDSIGKNILTVEDPIEYEFSVIRQTQVNEKAGYDFSSAIRTFMRQDPDVILVGEIRDEETATLATRAALTGHLLLSTLHTNTAIGTIARLRDLGISHYLLASSLVGIVAQRLIRKLCSSCRRIYSPDEAILRQYGLAKDGTYYMPGKCPKCNNRGYVGREVISEVLVVTKEISDLLANDAPIPQIEEMAKSQGFISMSEIGAKKVTSGLTSLDELQRVIG